MTDIKSCPFCGYSARIKSIPEWWFVECNSCLSSTSECFTKDEAIAAWNKRADDALIAELATALEDIMRDHDVHDYWCPITHYDDYRGHQDECICRVIKINALLARVKGGDK